MLVTEALQLVLDVELPLVLVLLQLVKDVELEEVEVDDVEVELMLVKKKSCRLCWTLDCCWRWCCLKLLMTWNRKKWK